MFGKIFNSMYDGTLVTDWRALVTFQQLIVLCDSDGVVDMTPHAISARTGIPMEHIEAGLKVLGSPDPYSRTPDKEGRRIELIDDHRPWGWNIVNHAKYKFLISREDKKRKDRKRVADKRARETAELVDEFDPQANENADVAPCRKVSQAVADVAHTDTDTDTDTVKEFSSDSQANTDQPPVNDPSKIRKSQQEAIIGIYHEILPELPSVIIKRWHDSKNAKALAARWKEDKAFRSRAFWTTFFETVRSNPWWMGEPSSNGGSTWNKCNLAWLVKRENFDKVIEHGVAMERQR